MSFTGKDVPKLSFRQNPLRLPVKNKKPPMSFILDVEAPAPRPSGPKKSDDAQDPGSQGDLKLPLSLPTKRITMRIIFIGMALVLVIRLIQFTYSEDKMHTIYKLSCEKKKRVLKCDSAIHSGTFVVEIPSRCASSVYEIGGIPFSVSKQKGNIFKAPASDLTVKNVDGDCTIKAFVDSYEFKHEVPFTWITTHMHTWFTIRVNGHTVVERADASLFESVQNGIWIAYTYDLNVKYKDVVVTGDGTDMIFTYGV